MRPPRPGDILVSRDPRDHGRTAEVYGVSERFVYLRRGGRKTRVRLDRLPRDYRYEVED